MRVDRLASAQYNGLHGCGAQLNIRLEIVSCDSERFTAIAVAADLDSYEHRNDVILTGMAWAHPQPFPSVVAKYPTHHSRSFGLLTISGGGASFTHTLVHRSKIMKNHKSHSELQ